MTTALVRNRDYRLLWGSRVLSEFGFHASTIAFPLVAVAITGSATAAGLVLGSIAAAQLIAGLPAGTLVDRWDRKKVMLGCELVQAVVAASLVVALVWHVATIGHMMAAAAAMGVCIVLFQSAEDAVLPKLVPEEQLSSAVAMTEVRVYLGSLSGTSAGGLLFAIGRFVPFLADLVTHVIAFGSLLFFRVPPREALVEQRDHFGREMLAGLRWVWDQRRIRVTALCAVFLNLFFTAFYIVVIVLAQTSGVPSAQIGMMAAMLGAGGFVGSLAASYLHRRTSPHALISGVFWIMVLLMPVAAFTRSGYVLGALFFAMGLVPPSANVAIMTQLLLLTPDGLRGRLSGAVGMVVGVAGVAGPLLGGLLADGLAGGPAVLVCAAGIAIVAVLVTASPALRSAPPQETTPEPVVTIQDMQARMEGESDMDENARYEVLRNNEDQYSLWLAGHDVPAGWQQVGMEGTKEECMAYVDEVWTDMRPRSLRERMDKAGS